MAETWDILAGAAEEVRLNVWLDTGQPPEVPENSLGSGSGCTPYVSLSRLTRRA